MRLENPNNELLFLIIYIFTEINKYICIYYIMSKQIVVYYYATDPKIEDYSVKLPSYDPNQNSSYNVNSEATIFPIYDGNFIEIGKIKRFGTNATEINGINQFISWHYTIYFYNNNNSVSFEINNIEGEGSFYKPNVSINSVITSCSGNIYANRGTVEIYPYNNQVKSRKITINIY